VVCEELSDAEVGDGLRYLNHKNYGRQLYRRKRPGAAPGEFTRGYRGGSVVPEVPGGLRNEAPERIPEVVAKWWANLDKERPAQVITLEDAIKVAALCHPFASMMCECRLWSRAREERNPDEYSCGGLGVGMLKWERWPERYKGGVNFMTFEEARDWLTKWVMRGMVPIIMTYGAPYVGGLCLCDYPDCGMIRRRLDVGIGCLKGHEVATVDYDRCNGCGVCVQRCQWGALKFEVTTGQAHIDQYRCFGCGVCAVSCPRGAISLKPRKDLPALAEVW